MSEQKRMTSIAMRINRSFTIRMILVLLTVDALAGALAVGGWCYTQEKTALGIDWTPFGISRDLEWNPVLPLWVRPGSVQYTFYGNDPTTVFRIDGGMYFQTASILMYCLIGAEFLLLLGQYGAGKRRAQILLSPLYRMADDAQKLINVRFDEQKYHDLENAIARISPDAPDAKLTTGDKDLQGLEKAVNSLLNRMRDAYREQTRFVSDASHELRTPIAVIQGYANMLDRWGKDDEKILTESIAAIKTESASMQKLVEQLLFLARGDSGNIKTAFECLDLTSLLREVYDESQMIYPDHEWQFTGNASIYVNGDAQLLKQAMRILTQNAAKFTPSNGRITLNSFINSKAEPCFSVQDNGVGISGEDIPHIFERFYRSDPSRKRAAGGTGLGLAIAKWIVDRHYGYFDILSRTDVGTRFTICLPAIPVTAHAADNPIGETLPR
jgi:signal transduction histidine kinase